MNKQTKQIIRYVAVATVTLGLLYTAHRTYDFVYKRGVEAGTKNQLICAASVRDETLKPLCK